MKWMGTFTPAVLGAALLLGCSSAPNPPQEINLLRNKAADNTKFGNQYYDQAQFDQALSFFELALQNNMLIDNREGLAASFNSLGRTYLALGQIPKAQQSFLEARALARELAHAGLILQSETNLAEVQIRQGQVDQAIVTLEQILAKGGSGQPETGVVLQALGGALRKKATVLNSQGQTEEAQGLFQRALAYFNQAAQINRSRSQNRELASNLYMISAVQFRLKNYPEALQTVQLALEQDRKMENSLGIAQDLRLEGEIHNAMGSPDKAFDRHLRSYRIFQVLQNSTQMAQSLDFMIPLLETLGLSSDAQNYRAQRQALGPAL